MIQKVIILHPNVSYDNPVIVPVYLPDFDDIRRLAEELHVRNQPYAGEYKGWPVCYQPADTEPPAEDWSVPLWSNFQIGVWPIWSVTFDWEDGDDQPPNIGIDNKNIVINGQLPRRKSADELLAEIEQMRKQSETIAM